MILYFHGFKSSPQSFKARLLEEALSRRGLAAKWHCPQLPVSPAAALDLGRRMAGELVAEADPEQLTLVGSSLGGFYATCLAETFGCRAVLLNPVVHAARDLATQVGTHRHYHTGQKLEFLPEHVRELADAEAAIPALTHMSRYFLIAATGDEVLDWHDMQSRYAGAPQTIIQGSDHGLSDFSDHIDAVMAFAQL